MTDRPCATCNEAHPQRRGRDGLPTFAAEDGHPFRVVQGEAKAEWVAPAVAYGSREGWRASFFGALLSCERCGATCDPKHRDLLVRHEESHG